MEFIEEDGEAAFYGPKIDIKLLGASMYDCCTVDICGYRRWLFELCAKLDAPCPMEQELEKNRTSKALERDKNLKRPQPFRACGYRR